MRRRFFERKHHCMVWCGGCGDGWGRADFDMSRFRAENVIEGVEGGDKEGARVVWRRRPWIWESIAWRGGDCEDAALLMDGIEGD